MPKPTISMISGPMDAKHVSGVNVTGTTDSSLDSYFDITALEPDEFPSHTFVATGKTEVPKRSDTIASTIRRPSVSLKRSLSKLRRRRSLSHHPEVHWKPEGEHQAETPIGRSDSSKALRTLEMQSSISRLRQKVGLDRDLYAPISVSKPQTPEPETAPNPVPKDYPPLRVRRSLVRLTSSSSHTIAPNLELGRTGIAIPRQSSTIHQQPSTSQRKPDIVRREQSSIQPQLSNVQHRSSPSPPGRSNTQTKIRPPVRPKRADSGTAIDFHDVPVNERPLGFREILAVQSHADRMVLYKETREYWANADHGLMEWTERARGPRLVAARV